MYLKSISLQNFRSFKEKSFSFSPQTNLIFGPNTAGKTNILEAIYLLATGQSFRAEVEKEMIKEGEEIARISCELTEAWLLEIVLTTGQVSGQPAPHKKYLLNNVSKRMIDFVGSLRAVLFWPEDLDLVTNSPSRRRRYLDFVLCQVDREYRRSLTVYEKGVRQRNRLLERIRDEGIGRNQLLFWDKLLIKNGALITDKRAEFIEFINNYHLSSMIYSLEYDKSVISEARLAQYTQEEVAAGVTLVGPHRDDLKFLLSERNLSLFGSRGEQRMAILWLKLAELNFVTEKTGERPLLLLDDIFSELDHQHRDLVLKVIPEQQTIMTTTDLHLIEKSYQEQIKVIKLE